MDIASLRWQYYFTSTLILVAILVAFQSWRNTVDWGFIAGAAVLYFLILVAIDIGRNRKTDS